MTVDRVNSSRGSTPSFRADNLTSTHTNSPSVYKDHKQPVNNIILPNLLPTCSSSEYQGQSPSVLYHQSQNSLNSLQPGSMITMGSSPFVGSPSIMETPRRRYEIELARQCLIESSAGSQSKSRPAQNVNTSNLLEITAVSEPVPDRESEELQVSVSLYTACIPLISSGL